MKLSDQRSLHLVLALHLLAFLCHDVAANTEIINFSSSRERPVDLPWDVVGNWTTLRPSDNERRWTLQPAALHTPLHRVCERERSSVDTDTVASHPPFSCPHELWLFLDLDDEKWASYSSFTLRLSWPASIPADFAITTYTPNQLLAFLADKRDLNLNLVSSGLDGTASHAHTSLSTPRITTTTTTTSTTVAAAATRARYARIRAVDAGVPAPGPGSRSPRGIVSPPAVHPQSRPPRARAQTDPDPDPDSDAGSKPRQPHSDMPVATEKAVATLETEAAASQEARKVVPFMIILEPTYMGVLPATLLPTVGFLVPVMLTAAFLVVPWVMAYFEPFVREARLDAGGRTSMDKDK